MQHGRLQRGVDARCGCEFGELANVECVGSGRHGEELADGEAAAHECQGELEGIGIEPAADGDDRLLAVLRAEVGSGLLGALALVLHGDSLCSQAEDVRECPVLVCDLVGRVEAAQAYGRDADTLLEGEGGAHRLVDEHEIEVGRGQRFKVAVCLAAGELGDLADARTLEE